MAPRVAIVTGSNKGIGLAIVRALCKQFQGDIFLTSRDVGRGQTAVKTLENEGLHPKFHQLDIEDSNSIKDLCDYMKKNYGGVDVLINNAGFAFKTTATESFAVQAKVSIAINYTCTLNVTKAFMPLMKDNGRIVIVSSFVAPMVLNRLSEARQAQFKNKSLNEDGITALLKEFVASAENDTVQEDGWAKWGYAMSKLGLTAVTKPLAKYANECGKTGILINCCSPGWVKTDMAGDKATKTPDQGAESSVYLAMLPEGATEPQGEHVNDDNSVVDWQKNSSY